MLQKQQKYDIFLPKGGNKMRTDFEISDFFQDANAKCSKVTKRSFSKGELITTYIEKRNQMCILLSRYSQFNSL